MKTMKIINNSRIYSVGLFQVLCCSFFIGQLQQGNRILFVNGQKNDLNYVLQYIINEMNTMGFFEMTWKNYISSLPIPVITESCIQEGKLIPMETADDVLKTILTNQVVRIGLSQIGAGIPAYYSIEDPTNPTDLNSGNLTGYEIACAKEATRLLGFYYNITDMETNFIVIDGDTYYEPLLDALNNNEIDIIWSAMYPTDDRALDMDFTCPTFVTEQVIGVGPDIGSSEIPKSSTNVACVRGFCSLTVPDPFVLLPMDKKDDTTDNTIIDEEKELLNLLIDPNDDIDYVVYSFDLLSMFYETNCTNCSYVQLPNPLSTVVRMPATKILTQEQKDSMNATNNNSTTTSSSIFYNQPVIIIIITTISFTILGQI